MRELRDTDVIEAVGSLVNYLGRRPIEGLALGVYVREMLGMRVAFEHFAEAMVAWMRTHGAGAFMPSPTELAAHVRGYLLASARANKRDPFVFDRAERRQKTEHGKEAMALIRRRMTGAIEHDAYLVEMRAMEAKYPGIGWREAAEALERLTAADKAHQQRLPEAGQLQVGADMVTRGLIAHEAKP